MYIKAMVAVALFLGGQTGPAQAQDAESTQLEDIVVEGRRLRDAVERFVDDVVAPPVGRGPARWHRTVCVGVVNLRGEAAQAIADQVSAVAFKTGLRPGEPGCRPTVMVIVTDDGPAMATALVEASPRAFRPAYGGAARSSEALERFQNGPAAVRWWHVSMPVDRDTGTPAVRIPGYAAPVISQIGSSLKTQIRNDLQRAFVIVDLNRAAGTTVQQLGDYIGMIALAQIDPDAETAAYDTVLNLFAGNREVGGITSWDISYLTSLYDAELNQRASNQQGGEISSMMLQDRRRAPIDDPD